jgi:putative ABC transport system substrate-binding protein
VESLAHPGGNVTGVTAALPTTVVEKNLEHLARLLPGLSRVGFLAAFDPGNEASSMLKLQAATSAVDTLGLQLKTLEVRSADDVEPVLADALAESVQALLVFTGPNVIIDAVPRFVEFQTVNRIPVVFDNTPTGTTRRGLLSYNNNKVEEGRLAASLVDKVLKGADPANLPLEQPTVYDFVLNQTVANALGITVPPDVAQEVTHWDQ